jgi:hypothetical protein
MMTDKLFKSDKDCYNNACLDPYSDMTFAYIEGYKRAADKLVNEAGSDIDWIVYPIVFLYRHHIEISLKATIATGNELLETLNSTHRLTVLWAELKRIVKEIWEEEFPEKDFEFIDSMIQEFEKYDENSDSFRYSKDKKGNKNKYHNLLHINIRHLRDMVQKFHEILSPIGCRISFYFEYPEEFRLQKSNK